MALKSERIQTKKRLFNIDEYYRMAEVGIVGWDERTELLDGEIVTMSPINSPHSGHVIRLNALLGKLVGDIAVVSVQNPVQLDYHTEPQPDVALLKARADFYEESHPTPPDIFLLVEVSDSILNDDWREKLPMYARAGIPTVWILNLIDQSIEVYTEPQNGKYAKVENPERGQSLPVPGIPGASLKVDDILGS